MSIQPWQVREYEWCESCGARVINEGDNKCTMCAAHFRLHQIELDDEVIADMERGI